MNFHKVGTIKINGDSWEYGWGYAGKTKGKKNDGICKYEQRRIVINRRPVSSFPNVICHEVAHARFRDMEEDAIEELGNIFDEVYQKMLNSISVGGSAPRLRGR